LSGGSPPAGGFFTDSDRAAGVFGVTGTAFAVLLAFVIFLSFSSYDRAREKASLEAVAVSQLFRTANAFFGEHAATAAGRTDLLRTGGHPRRVEHDARPA